MDYAQREALRLSEGLPLIAANLDRVGRATSPELARWAFSQWALRQRARSKFSRASEMLFDADGLEMATHGAVAAFHASLFPVGVKVADATCGIGADLVALAGRGPAVGFELNPDRAEMARHNLGVYGLTAEVSIADGLSASLPEFAFADPSRRPDGRRTLDLGKFEPDVLALTERFLNLELGVIKLSPMLSDADLDRVSPHRVFVSVGHECREALALLGRRAGGGVRAYHVESESYLPGGIEPKHTAQGLSNYLWEADPAAIRAHALGNFVAEGVGDSNGYLTSEEPATGPWLRSYRILAEGGYDPKRLTKTLRDFDSATPVLKQRGAGLDLISLGKKLRLNGSRTLAVAFWRSGAAIRFAVCEISPPLQG